MKVSLKPVLVAVVVAAAGIVAMPAEARVVVGVGVGIGVPFGYGYPGYYPGYAAPYPYYPQRVIVEPPPAPPPPAAPDPIFYPKTGQTPAQTEADRRECNRWAASQPSAMGDATVFQRATYACMEGHGYTVK